MSAVAGFPFVTVAEFRLACRDLDARLRSVMSLWQQHNWTDVRLDEKDSNGDTMLVIVKSLDGKPHSDAECPGAALEATDAVDEYMEDDPVS